MKLDHSERILAKLEKEKVPCQLLVIEGAGHGFGGEDGKRASKALVEWFNKYLAKPDNADDRSAIQEESAAR